MYFDGKREVVRRQGARDRMSMAVIVLYHYTLLGSLLQSAIFLLSTVLATMYGAQA